MIYCTTCLKLRGDLIDWTDTTISEPSFTYSVTSNEIKEMIDSKVFSEFKMPELPCHQARSQDLKKGGGYFERVRSVHTTLTRIFIDLESVSDGLSEI